VANEDEFRAQLDARISRYASQRDGVQAQLVELNHALNSIDKRLDAAIEMYRLEFDAEPDVAKEVGPSSLRRAGGRRRQRNDGSSWNQVVAQVLEEAGSPLHLNHIWQRIQETGFDTRSRDPLRSLASVLVRHPEVHRTGRNIYALKSVSAQLQESLDLAAGEATPAHEGEAA
jgi:hypothetical protein